MHPILRGGLLCAGLLCLSSAARAQGRNVPGAVQSDALGALSEYRREVLRQAEELISQWRDAWGNRDAGVMATLYTRDAVLVGITGEVLRGQAAIRAGLPAMLAKAGPISTTHVDFGTSGELTFTVEQFTYGVVENGAPGKVRTGIAVTVLKRHWDGWLIQSQTLSLSADAAD